MRNFLIFGIATIVFSSCASGPTCKTDACYNRRMANVDLYKSGEIAAWGSEKEYGAGFEEDENRQPAAVKRHDRDR